MNEKQPKKNGNHDPTLLTGHAQSLTGLKHKTTYHYRVKSSDANGNLSISGDGSFKTR